MRGTKLHDRPHRFELRMTDREREQLNAVALHLGVNQADVLRRGLHELHTEMVVRLYEELKPMDTNSWDEHKRLGLPKVEALTDAQVAELDPGVRGLVQLLRQHQFNTTDSGDGRSKGDAGADFPHVHVTFSVVHAAHVVLEAQRLCRVLASIGVEVREQRDDKDVFVQATYDPVSGVASISLFNADDALLQRVGSKLEADLERAFKP